MRWLARLIDKAPVSRDVESLETIARSPRAADTLSEESMGIDGAPAMAFTDSMPSYLLAIDRPSAHTPM